MSGPRGVESEASEKALLEEPTRGRESEGDVDKEGSGCGGDGGGGRRDEDATGWMRALEVSRGSRKAALDKDGQDEADVGEEWGEDLP